MSEPKMMSWWTTNGWIWQEAPGPHVAMIAADEDDCRDMMEAAGYTKHVTYGGFDSDFEITIYRHPGSEGHPYFYVDVMGQSGQVVEFFVDAPNFAAFVVEKLLDLVRHQKLVDEIDWKKAFIAWVRHGHGKTTIDEFCTETLEERASRIDNWNWEEERKAREAAKAAKPA